MDQAQAKALAASEPFIVLATTTKAPSHRFLADLIGRATSAQGTYIFTELLQTPAIQSCDHLRLLPNQEHTSRCWKSSATAHTQNTRVRYTTRASTRTNANIPISDTPEPPPLTPTQETKLRQLTLLTLASSPTALTYANLLTTLSLPDTPALETLITQSIYASLLHARLSPTSNPPIVHITSVAPLRDLRPLSLPEYTTILSVWESRCAGVISNLEASIESIRRDATARSQLGRKRQDVVDQAVLTRAEQQQDDGKTTTAGGMTLRGAAKGGVGISRTAAAAGMTGNKRDRDEHMLGEEDEEDFEDASEEGAYNGGGGGMDIDDGAFPPLGGVGMGRSSKKRGARSGR